MSQRSKLLSGFKLNPLDIGMFDETNKNLLKIPFFTQLKEQFYTPIVPTLLSYFFLAGGIGFAFIKFFLGANYLYRIAGIFLVMAILIFTVLIQLYDPANRTSAIGIIFSMFRLDQKILKNKNNLNQVNLFQENPSDSKSVLFSDNNQGYVYEVVGNINENSYSIQKDRAETSYKNFIDGLSRKVTIYTITSSNALDLTSQIKRADKEILYNKKNGFKERLKYSIGNKNRLIFLMTSGQHVVSQQHMIIQGRDLEDIRDASGQLENALNNGIALNYRQLNAKEALKILNKEFFDVSKEEEKKSN